MQASSLSQSLSLCGSVFTLAGRRPHQLLSVVTLGSGPHAFPFSSAQIKKILCILGALRWGNSAKHIRWQKRGRFMPRNFSILTHIYTHIKTIFQPSFSPRYAASCPNVLPVPDQKACVFIILSKGDCKSQVCLVLCV